MAALGPPRPPSASTAQGEPGLRYLRHELVGSTLGRYRVSRRIGAGAMGVVYEATDVERNLVVALKTLNYLEPEAIYRLKNEFRSLAGVAHPNLVGMHELSCVGEQWFFVMDHVDGVTFTEHFRELRRVTEGGGLTFYGRLGACVGELVAGVQALHELGKIHRDLKPSNVLVSRAGRVVILDFGLSSDARPAPDQSGLGVPAGTPLYMAPEIFTGEPQGPAADWYAVGLIIYEALTGRLPFVGQPHQLMAQKLFETPAPPSRLAPDVPASFDELCVRLLSRDPAQRPSGAELEALFPASRSERRNVSRPPPAVALVGRAEELARLRAAFDSVQDGKAAIVAISGESGIGKTALVGAFLHELREQHDVKVLAGRCYEHESVPYKAFDQVADALSRYLCHASDTDAALAMPREPRALAALFPVLDRVPVVRSTARALPHDRTEVRRLGFGAFRETLCRIADRQKLVLFVDDLQWSDADSALLFRHVFGGKHPPSCLFIACSREPRPEAMRALLTAIEQDSSPRVHYVELELAGLSEAESTELLRRTGLDGEGFERAVRSISAEAKGSPFFVTALARDAMRDPERGDSISSFMRRWIGTLPRGPAELLEVVAVAGRPVHEEVVAAVLGTADIVADALSLAAQHFIGAWPSPTRRLECYHDRIREAVIAGLPPERARSLHARLARVLEARGDADARELAVHFLAAGESVTASRHAELAADAARGTLAFLDAARWYETALASEPVGSQRARELREKLGDAYSLAGHGVTAARWLLEAARDAPREDAMQIRQRAAELLLVSGHVDAGVEVLGQVLAHVHMQVPSTPRRSLASLIWQRARLELRGLDFRERSEAEIPRERLLEVDACWSAALGLGLVDPIRATDFQTRNLRLALDAGEPLRIARALAMEVSFRASGGSRTEAAARELCERAMQLAERLNNPHVLGLATFSAGFAEYLVGRWKAAHALLARAEQMLADIPGAIWERNASQRFQLNALAFMGDLPAIARRVPDLIQHARERGNLHAECALRVRLSGLLSLAADEPDVAAAETREMMQRWSQDGFHLQHYNELYSLVNCALYRGDGAAALERMQTTWPRLAGSLLMRSQAVRVEIRHVRTRACLSALRHEPTRGEARALLLADIAELRRERVPWADAFASFAEALLHAHTGRPERARDGLERAEEKLAAGDMELLATAARFRRGELTGGDAGRGLVEGAREWFASRGVKSPERFVEHCAPAPVG